MADFGAGGPNSPDKWNKSDTDRLIHQMCVEDYLEEYGIQSSGPVRIHGNNTRIQHVRFSKSYRKVCSMILSSFLIRVILRSAVFN